MRKLLIGAATLALAAGSAHADPGHGHGGGGGGGGGKGPGAEHGMNAGGGDKGHGPKMAGNMPGQGQGHADRGPAERRPADRGPANRGPAMHAAQGPSIKAEHRAELQDRRIDRSPVVRQVRDTDRHDTVRYAERDNRRFEGGDRGIAWNDAPRGLIDGCPPGLAKKNNGCTPPGLARSVETYRQAYYRPQWFGYNSLGDGRYYYDNGYLYRTNDGGSVLGYVPLLGGALSIGNQWPSYYQPVSVPDYYVDYYGLGPAGGYRYADNVLYRVDPQSSAITSIAALLTGDQFAVGQPMPAGYDVYNVPYAYQDRYVDGPDSYYRYADGYVYQVDPTTQLIQAAIQLLT